MALNQKNHLFSLPFLAILVFSTLSAAAAGNVINDYFDIESDAFNKPEKALLVLHFGKEKLLKIYIICLLATFLSAFAFDFFAAVYWLSIYQAIIALLLFLYSFVLKKWALIGNLCVALLCALSLAIVAFAYDVRSETMIKTDQIYWLFIGFAFLMTLFREIIKDIEDIEGDIVSGCRTIPVVFGIKKAVWIATVPLLFTILLVFMLLANPELSIPAVLLLVGLIAVLFRIFRAHSKSQFHSISQITKWLMFLSLWILL